MKDSIGFSPLTTQPESCYITPLNETANAYDDLILGFSTNDYMVEGEFDFEAYEEALPELYKSIKKVDDQKRVWYPKTVVKDEGVVFVVGTNKDDWQWASIKNTPVSDDEKERFKNPQTGEYLKFKSDPKSLTQHGQNGFIEALDSLDLLK